MIARLLTARNAGFLLAVLALGVVTVGLGLSFSRKAQLRHVRQAATQSDGARVGQAVDDWRARGWLEDGHLQTASFNDADLRGADLHAADLWRATFVRADLRGADLSGANLTEASLFGASLDGADLSGASLADASLGGASLAGADLSAAALHGASLAGVSLDRARGLTDAQLAQAGGLLGASMPDGSRYDGRYRLPADISLARARDVVRDDDAAMAAFYGVPLAAYQDGQAWAEQDDNLGRVLAEGAPRGERPPAGQVEPGAVAVLAALPFSLLAALLVFGMLPAPQSGRPAPPGEGRAAPGPPAAH